MLTELTECTTVYVVTGYTDMRKGIDGLAAIISGKLALDPFSKSLFLFCGKNNGKLKGLLWESDGFLLLNKRLENGRYCWPRNETEARLLTAQQLRWLMEGLAIEQKKAIKTGKTGTLY
jgi:transposase